MREKGLKSFKTSIRNRPQDILVKVNALIIVSTMLFEEIMFCIVLCQISLLLNGGHVTVVIKGLKAQLQVVGSSSK